MIKMITLGLLLIANLQSVDTQKLLSKNWKLNSIEEFGNKFPVSEQNSKDKLNLLADGTYSMILYGAEKSGKWSFNKTANTINFNNGDEKLFFKLIQVQEKTLIFEYQQPSLIRSKLHFDLIE